MQDPHFVRSAFSAIAPRYVCTNHVLSLGFDILWRRKTARMVAVENPSRILDLATGSGDLMAEMTRRCPQASITGADFCIEMLEQARRRGLPSLLVADALQLPFADGSFDAVTVAFGLRNMESWPVALREMRRVLRPGGRLVVLDFSLPDFPVFRGLYRFYLKRVLPAIAGFITRQHAAYVYLAESIGRFPSGSEMCSLIEEQEYVKAMHVPLSGGIAAIYCARVPEAEGHELSGIPREQGLASS